MAKTKKSLGGSVIETIKTIVYALILAGIFRALFFHFAAIRLQTQVTLKNYNSQKNERTLPDFSNSLYS